MWKKALIIITIISLLFSSSYFILADESSSKKSDLEEKIKEYEAELSRLGEQKGTLSSEIQYMDTQMYLTELKIQETEQNIESTQKEISLLNDRIEGLDDSLSYLAKILIKRIVQGYKQKNASFLDLLLDSSNANDLIDEIKYQKIAQKNNEKLLVQVQQTKLNFEEQKTLREEKKAELDNLKLTLDNYKADLNNQKLAKQRLLEATKNNERTYQNLLAQAKAEYASIIGIIAGAGTENKLRDVKKGDAIATIISGASCNSNGTHLHFMFKDGTSEVNPFNYLKGISHENCSGSSCGSGDGDSFNPSGDLDWPIDGPIKLTQGYGDTWAVKNTWVRNIYSFHNGIDFNGPSTNVRALADGELYRGSYGVGCSLSYAKLVHKDSNLVTYYLHVYVN